MAMRDSVKKKKLVIVTTVAETLSTILAGQPRRLSESFDITLISGGHGLDEVGKFENVSIIKVSMVRGISPFKDVISILTMVFALVRLRPHMVHSYTPKAGLVAMAAAWLCGTPIRIHTFTGLLFPTAKGFRRRMLMWADRIICLLSTNVVPEGHGVRDDLLVNGITRKDIKVIGWGNIAGVDTNYFCREDRTVRSASKSLRESLLLSSDIFIYCFVGRLNQDKGLEELFAAFDSLSSGSHLIIVGGLDEAAPISDGLKKAITAHPRISYLGFLADIRPVLCMAHVMVLPSYREGFPNVLLQAGAMGLPAIATDINGCNEIISHGVNGWLINPRDVTSLRRAMERCEAVSQCELRSMGADARIIVESKFERKRHWERMEAFYRQLLTNSDS